MQSENPLMADFVKLMNSAAGTLAGMTREARDTARERFRETFGGMDFVSRDEFDAVKDLAAKASWEAANACLQFHGGFGFACEYDVERKFRETRLYQVAPISTNLIFSYVAEHVLGLPRSF